MLAQTSAFLTRSIRQESRLLSHHMIRSGMVLMMLYLLGLQVLNSPRMGASGLDLIRNVMNCCYWCLTLLGVTYFSVAITEEKEEETLPLLRMTGIRNITLLIGKSVPRLAVVMLLILIAAPFLMLAVTLGGVVPEQIMASLMGLFCYAFCLSQLGLFASTTARTSSRAVSTTILLWMVLEFGSWLMTLCGILSDEWGFGRLKQWFASFAGSLWERTMWHASASYLMFDRGEILWHPQMTFQLLVGFVFFALSLLCFERFNERAISQGAASVVDPKSPLAELRRNMLSPLRSWDAAIAWKSWQFVAGGWFWFWMWMIGLPVASISIILVISILIGAFAPSEAFGVTLMMAGTGGLIVLLARLLGSLLNREIYEQTIVSLLMLPQKSSVLLRQMVTGLLPFVLPPIFCFGLGYLWMLMFEPRFFEDTIDLLLEPWFWATLSWAVFTLSLGTLLSVYLRHGGMMVGMAVCVFILPFMGGMMIAAFGMLFRGIGASGDFFQYVVPVFLLIGHVAACLVIQKLILRRVETVAAR